eukprot:scaffold198255_cov32-Tisochrysis_lutea.AAC.2
MAYSRSIHTHAVYEGFSPVSLHVIPRVRSLVLVQEWRGVGFVSGIFPSKTHQARRHARAFSLGGLCARRGEWLKCLVACVVVVRVVEYARRVWRPVASIRSTAGRTRGREPYS